MIDGDELIAKELGRPVTLLAGLGRGSELLDSRWDGAWIGVPGDREHLAYARQFRFDVPARPCPNVTLRALDAGMRRAAVGGELRLHHAVAHQAAESVRLAVVIALVAHQADERQAKRHEQTRSRQRPPVGAEAQIDPGVILVACQVAA